MSELDEVRERWSRLPPELRKEVSRRGSGIVPFLCDLVESNGFTRVLEIGTFKGRTACFVGAACEPFGGRVATINIDASELAAARELAAILGVVNVDFIHGDSVEVIDGLSGPWDLVFVDGAHSHARTRAEYAAVREKMAANSFIVFDDATYVHGDGRRDGGVPCTVREIGAELRLGRTFALIRSGDVRELETPSWSL